MKKITLLLLLLSSTFTFTQQVVTIVSINGQALADFKVTNNATLQVGTKYDFIIDYSGQDVSSTNNVIVKMLKGSSFADTANETSVAITTASGQVTVSLTPTEAVSSAILQIRTTTSKNFGNTGDNIFDYSWKVVGGTASTKDFKLTSSFYNVSKSALVIKDNIEGEFSIYNMLGQQVLNGTISNEIKVETLKSGLYILSTDKGTLKFVK
ncbi:T9SS type A sorting domain-containing protein [Polaribacter staleyi]|uniref:T9SS type A sorting domain-containing protein n=1 Tax=Polaribacter staleyi TaxID=2022337 RepID=UPI0031BAB42A